MTELPGQLADPGRYLRAQRELADVSRNTLARLARASESYLTQVEKGQEQPPAAAAAEFRSEMQEAHRPWRGVRFALFYLLSIWSWLGNGVPLCQGRTWPKRTSSP